MTDETLKKFLPNYIAPGVGEDNLIDKIYPFVEAAESWADNYVADARFIGDSQGLQKLRDNIVAARALYLASPALDVTMHPNGLAVVNTDSLAPASAERSKEFRKAIDRQTLGHIDRFLEYVYNGELAVKFLATTPGRYIWGATVFRNCSEIVSYTGIEPAWNILIEFIRIISALEHTLAEKFISDALLHRLRLWKLSDLPQPSVFTALCSDLKRVLGEAVASNRKPNFDDMRLIVDRIRKNPDLFPDWHRSDTARLYLDPPAFQNKKKSGGYFF